MDQEAAKQVEAATVCAWCGGLVSAKGAVPGRGQAITHGLCRACFHDVLEGLLHPEPDTLSSGS